MKVSAFVLTSGLGQKTVLAPSPPSLALTVSTDSLSSEAGTSSNSGDPERELGVLCMLTNPPCIMNFGSGILKGGGGGVGITGLCAPLTFSSQLLALVGNGGRPVVVELEPRRLDGSGGGVGTGVFRFDDLEGLVGGGGGGGGGGCGVAGTE